MGQRGNFDLSEAGRKLAVVANWVVRICGSVIFLFLTWYSLRYTQYMNPGGEESPVNVQDSVLQNLLVVMLVIAVFVWLLQLEKHVSERIQWRIKTWTFAAALLWVGALGLWWITSAERIPEGDQAYIYGGASYFLEGNYSFLGASGYCGMHPHQLGLIALMELLFLFAGTYNYFAFQFLCVMMAVGIVYMGYHIVQCITDRMSVAVGYCLAMMGCLPLIFYTSWVYGDVPSTFFAMLAAWMLLRYTKKRHWGYLAVLVISLTLAVLVRKNSWIFVIAFCIIALVQAIRDKDVKILGAAALSVLLPVLAFSGICKMYEVRSGYEHSRGLPNTAWIAMGMQESNGNYGWYNDYPKQTYYSVNFDTDAADIIARQDIKDSLRNFASNPSYAWTFFREKILSQWNEPLYQSLYFSAKYPEGYQPPENSFAWKITGEYFTDILRLCDRLQFVLYFGMLLYFIFGVTPKSELPRHFLVAAMIGGFLFTILWEAKARYVLPYYITMFSFAAVGYFQMLAQIGALFKRRKREMPDNITKFRKAA